MNRFTQYWLDHLESQMPKEYCYHRSEHTLLVMSSVRQMAQYIGFSRRAVHLMQISALFHDMGYLQNPKEHEERSVEYINHVAKELQLTPNEIQSVGQMILKTHPSRRPNNLMQAILKDADLSYLGMAEAQRWSQLLEREYLNLGKIHSTKEFREIEHDFLNQHIYNTQYAQIVFGPAKRKYMKKMDLITH